MPFDNLLILLGKSSRKVWQNRANCPMREQFARLVFGYHKAQGKQCGHIRLDGRHGGLEVGESLPLSFVT